MKVKKKSITKSIHQNKKETPQLFAATGYMLLVIPTKLHKGTLYILASSTAVKFAEMSNQRTELLPHSVPTKTSYSPHAFNTRETSRTTKLGKVHTEKVKSGSLPSVGQRTSLSSPQQSSWAAQ